MNANPNQRPTANELFNILDCWDNYMKNMDIKKKKLKLYLKKLIKKYQIFQPHMKRNLMLFILVEHLHSVMCQNPLIHLLLLLHILMKKIMK
ncbi:hypothetical protein RhiirA1_423830, partial [Rhizophagus irregularis]